VDFLPVASFGLALRRGTGVFAARPYRERVAEAWLLDQPLPPMSARRGRITRRWAVIPTSPGRLRVDCRVRGRRSTRACSRRSA